MLHRFVHLGVILLALVAGCGRDNVAEDRVPRTPDERARAALESGDYSTAIDVLEELIASEPDNYERYALLAAGYAARAGLAILDIVKAQFTSGGSGSTSLIGQVGSFLPANSTAANLEDMAASLAKLNAIPAADRAEGADTKYGASASFQLTLYSAAYSVMYLQKFTVPGDITQFDPNKLATMTDADVDAILDSLVLSAESGTGPAAGMGEAVGEALEEIDSQPGATTREKLINYLNNNNTGG